MHGTIISNACVERTVEGDRLGAHAVGGEVRSYGVERGVTDRGLALGREIEDLVELCGERVDVAGRDEEAGDAVVDRLARAAVPNNAALGL